jgi:uncharacterized protein (TIGR02646 family)
MRFVIKPDAHMTALLSCQATQDALLEIATNMMKDNISDTIYRESYVDADEKRSRVEDQLALSYYNKCAYCERLQKADIEHYRPKKKVNEDNAHNGYYWLCYEWTNLLPACVKCNREGAKHSKFPIIGARVYRPSFLPNNQLNPAHQRAQNNPLLDEIPFLLHPEVDNPEAFFDFFLDPNGDGIRIRGIDGQNRGNETIEICLLNRQELRLERVEFVINPFKQAIESAFVKLSNGAFDDNEFEQQVIFQLELLINNATNVESTHTLLRKFIINSSQNFEDIILPYLDVKIQKIVLEAFKTLL